MLVVGQAEDVQLVFSPYACFLWSFALQGAVVWNRIMPDLMWQPQYFNEFLLLGQTLSRRLRTG